MRTICFEEFDIIRKWFFEHYKLLKKYSKIVEKNEFEKKEYKEQLHFFKHFWLELQLLKKLETIMKI